MTDPRFVILTHDFPFPHYDLMLESGDRLRTWRLLADPQSSCELNAEALPDHRMKYLDYEGPVSGGRGHVKRWDSGCYCLLVESETAVRLTLEGTKIRGDYKLCLVAGSGSHR